MLLAAARPPAATPAPHTAAPLAFVGHLPVVLHASRVGAEDEAVLVVDEGIENDLDAVGIVQRRVAAAVGHDDGLRVADVADDAEIKRVVRVDDPYFRAFGGLLPLVRRVLPKPARDRCVGIGRVAQDVAVHHGALFDPARLGTLDGGHGRRAE